MVDDSIPSSAEDLRPGSDGDLRAAVRDGRRFVIALSLGSFLMCVGLAIRNFLYYSGDADLPWLAFNPWLQLLLTVCMIPMVAVEALLLKTTADTLWEKDTKSAARVVYENLKPAVAVCALTTIIVIFVAADTAFCSNPYDGARRLDLDEVAACAEVNQTRFEQEYSGLKVVLDGEVVSVLSDGEVEIEQGTEGNRVTVRLRLSDAASIMPGDEVTVAGIVDPLRDSNSVEFLIAYLIGHDTAAEAF